MGKYAFRNTLQSQIGPSSNGANSELWQPKNAVYFLNDEFVLQFFWSVFDVFSIQKMGFNFLGKEVKVVSKLGIFIEQKKNEDEDNFLAVEQKQKSDRISFWRFFYLRNQK